MINHGRKRVKSVFQKDAGGLLFASYFIWKSSDANWCEAFLQILLHTNQNYRLKKYSNNVGGAVVNEK